MTLRYAGGCLALTVALVCAASAQNGPQGDKQFQAALHKEMVDGDLKAAIEEYRTISTRPGVGRELAATALVHMAECYQKLGDGEAQKIYERIVREFSDQKEQLVVARTRLGATARVASAKGDRSVWSPNADGFGTITPDGRFLTYADWGKTGGLILRDLITGKDRPLTECCVQFSAISKDGKQVAYERFENGKPDELRLGSLQGTGVLEFRVLLKSEEIPSIFPMDWSPDGKSLAVRLARKDRSSQVALVAVQDGALRVLKTTGWNDRSGSGKVFFSPDGRYIAYSGVAGDNGNELHVFIMTADGNSETAAVAHPSRNDIMGWSADGKHLLFASDRTGSYGLWALPVADGKPQAPPTLVKPDIGKVTWSLGVSASGTLYTWKNTGATYVQVSAIDLYAGTLLGPPTGISQRFVNSRGRPAWSMDGKQLAYSSCGDGRGCSLFIQSMESGKVREVPAGMSYFDFLHWSPDGLALLLSGTDANAKQAIYRVDTQTGDKTAVLVSNDNSPKYPQWALDGKHIYYRLRVPGSYAVMERDIASGTERELIRTPSGGGNSPFSLSPDGRSIAVISTSSSLLVVPSKGGEARTLFRTSPPEWLMPAGALAWTADSRAVLVVKVNKLLEVPIDGRQPRELDIDVSAWLTGEGFRLSPDGRHIAFVGNAGETGSEIWALENFLPAPPAKK